MDRPCENCSKEPNTRINISRFIEKLDACYETNNLEEAGKCLDFWEGEARRLQDEHGLLSVLNERLGYCRHTNNKEMMESVVQEIPVLMEHHHLDTSLSGATIFINLATTLCAFEQPSASMKYFEMAEKIYTDNKKTDTFEFATFLNNWSSALEDLKYLEDAEENYHKALDILNTIGNHEGEMAITYCSLALFSEKHKEESEQGIKDYLDKAWDCATCDTLKHDGHYAFILTKIAPTFRHFGRIDEADAFDETAQEIYSL